MHLRRITQRTRRNTRYRSRERAAVSSPFEPEPLIPTNYSTSFSGFNIGKQSTLFEEMSQTSRAFTIEYDATASEGGVLRMASGGSAAEYALAHPDIFSDGEVVVVFKGSVLADGAVRAWMRMSNASGFTGYGAFADKTSGNIGVITYVNGSTVGRYFQFDPIGFTLNNQTWYTIRFQIIGTSLKCKIWPTADPEPETWQHEGTDGDIATGRPGFGRFNTSGSIDFDFFSFSNGDNGSTPDAPLTKVHDFADWSNDYTVTLLGAARASNFSEFIGTVYLEDMPSSFWAAVESDGSDIRVTKSNGIQIPHHLVFIDTVNERGILRFKYPGTATLTAGVDTDIKIYTGNSTVSAMALNSEFGQYNVYRNSIKAVIDFVDSPVGLATVQDATENNNDATLGTDNAAWAEEDFVTTDFGYAYDFVVADQRYLSLPAAVYSSTNDFTVRLKARIDGLPGTFRIPFGARMSSGILTPVSLDARDTNVWASTWTNTSDVQFVNNGGAITSDVFYSLAGQFKAADGTSEIKLFTNGALTSSLNFTGTRKASATAVYIGCVWFSGARGAYFAGPIGSIFIEQDDMTANEIAAMTTNEDSPSSFYTIV